MGSSLQSSLTVNDKEAVFNSWRGDWFHGNSSCTGAACRCSNIAFHPLFNVKFDSESRQDPSSEFESVKTKLVLWSCFWFLFNVELWIPTARQPVGIQIRFSIQCACVNRNSESELQSCGRLRSRLRYFFSILLFFFNPLNPSWQTLRKSSAEKKLL
jgi:hypothetical protein